MRIVDEGKAKIRDMELSMHCLYMEAKKCPEYENSAHYHEYIEFLFSTDTNAEVWINGKTYPFLTGDLIVINSMEPHRLRFFANTNRYIVIKFSPQQVYTAEQSVFEMKYLLPFTLNDFSDRRRIAADVLKGSGVENSANTVYTEWKQKKYGYELAVRTHIFQIILWLLRHWHKENPELLTDINLSPNLAKAINYVWNNLAAATAENTAKFCGYSYTYFSEIFKKSMKINFRDYILNARITKAETLLLNTRADISEIAFEIGFSTTSHFIKQFKARKGITPAKYRAMIKENTDFDTYK